MSSQSTPERRATDIKLVHVKRFLTLSIKVSDEISSVFTHFRLDIPSFAYSNETICRSKNDYPNNAKVCDSDILKIFLFSS